MGDDSAPAFRYYPKKGIGTHKIADDSVGSPRSFFGLTMLISLGICERSVLSSYFLSKAR